MRHRWLDLAQLSVVGVVALGCSRRGVWVEHSCNTSFSPSRDALAFATDDSVILRRADGERRIAFAKAPCLQRGKDIDHVIALADGWRVLALGSQIIGGNFFESRGRSETTVSCLIDFRDMSVHPFDGALLGDLRDVAPVVGASSSWIYNARPMSDGLAVVDIDRRTTAKLFGVWNSGEIVVLETRAGLVTVATEFEQTHPDHPIYRVRLVVKEWDRSSWPPSLRSSKEIAVGGRADKVIVSADGAWAAYSGRPYSETGSHEPIFDLGLVDLTHGKIAFEQLGSRAELDVLDLIVIEGVPWLLATSRPPTIGTPEGAYQATWLDNTGRARGGHAMIADNRAQWIPWRSHVVVENGCSLSEVSLPPPASPQHAASTNK